MCNSWIDYIYPLWGSSSIKEGGGGKGEGEGLNPLHVGSWSKWTKCAVVMIKDSILFVLQVITAPILRVSLLYRWWEQYVLKQPWARNGSECTDMCNSWIDYNPLWGSSSTTDRQRFFSLRKLYTCVSTQSHCDSSEGKRKYVALLHKKKLHRLLT